MTTSRLVRRCLGIHCRGHVKGISSFPVIKGKRGERGHVCRWCLRIDREKAQRASVERRQRYITLCAKRKRLRRELIRLDADIADLKSQMERAS